MTSRQNRQCPKRAPMHRHCLDSLRIPTSGPCTLPPLSKPGITILPPCLQPPCKMKLPICCCDQDFSPCGATSFGQPSSPCCLTNFSDEDIRCSGPCSREGGNRNIEENDVPCSREASCNRAQQFVDENNEQANNRSPVCPQSYSPSITGQNNNVATGRNVKENRSKTSNILNKDNAQTCPYTSTPSGFKGRGTISRPDIMFKSMSGIQNISKTANVRNSATGQHFRDRDLEGVNVSKLPQSDHQDLNRISSTGANSEQNSDGSQSSLNESNPCCRRVYSDSQQNESDFQNVQEFQDQLTDVLKPSRANINNKCNNECITNTYPRAGYHDSKLNSSTRISQNKNTMGRQSMLSRSSKTASDTVATDEPLQNAINITPVGKICQQCNSTSNLTSSDRMTPTRSRPSMPDDIIREYEENENNTRSSTHDFLQSNQYNNDESDKDDEPHNCCVKCGVETESQVPPPNRRSTLMSSSRNILFKNDKDNHNSASKRQSNEELSDYDKFCQGLCDTKSIDHVNIPSDTSKSKFSSDYKTGSQKQLHSPQSQSRLQDRKEQSGTKVVHDIAQSKRPKQISSCCNQGISKFITETPEPYAKKCSTDIDCLCSDVLKSAQRKKKASCVHDVGATSCASTSCTVNTISKCHCRYPPAFKQFSCTGNISGSCNCDDSNN